MTEEKRIGRFSVFFGGIGPKVGPLSGKWHGEVKPKNDGKEIVSLSSAAVHSSNEMTLIFFNFSPQKNFFYLTHAKNKTKKNKTINGKPDELRMICLASRK